MNKTPLFLYLLTILLNHHLYQPAYAVNKTSKYGKTVATTCGNPDIKPFRDPIFNTTIKSRPSSWPWMAFLCVRVENNGSNDTCDYETSRNLPLSGAIVGSRWILATGGSFIPAFIKPHDLLIVAGAYNFLDDRPSVVQFASIKEFHLVDERRSVSPMLIELEMPLRLNTHVKTVCLPSTEFVQEEQQLYYNNSNKNNNFHVSVAADVASSSSTAAAKSLLLQQQHFGKPAWTTGWIWRSGQERKNVDYIAQIYTKTIYDRDSEMVGHSHSHGFATIWFVTKRRRHYFHAGSPMLRFHPKLRRWFQFGMLINDWSERSPSYGKFFYIPPLCQWINTTTQEEVSCIDVSI